MATLNIHKITCGRPTWVHSHQDFSIERSASRLCKHLPMFARFMIRALDERALRDVSHVDISFISHTSSPRGAFESHRLDLISTVPSTAKGSVRVSTTHLPKDHPYFEVLNTDRLWGFLYDPIVQKYWDVSLVATGGRGKEVLEEEVTLMIKAYRENWDEQCDARFKNLVATLGYFGIPLRVAISWQKFDPEEHVLQLHAALPALSAIRLLNKTKWQHCQSWLSRLGRA